MLINKSEIEATEKRVSYFFYEYAFHLFSPNVDTWLALKTRAVNVHASMY